MTTTPAATSTEVTAVIRISAAVGEAIRELGSCPSGELYVRLMDRIDIGTYNQIIGLLKQAGLVAETGHMLRWIGPNFPNPHAGKADFLSRAEPRHESRTTTPPQEIIMKAFLLDGDNGIVVFGSRKEAIAAASAIGTDPVGVFTSQDQLLKVLEGKTGAQLCEIFNSFTGVTPVKKFMNRSAAAARIWRECDKMHVEVAPVEVEDAPKADEEKHKAAKARRAAPAKPEYIAAWIADDEEKRKAAKARRAAKASAAAETTLHSAAGTLDAPREGTKLAIVLAMLKRPQGATLQEVMASQDWLMHTTRSLMSAGGTYARKYGITVLSEKSADGTRTFRVA